MEWVPKMNFLTWTPH